MIQNQSSNSIVVANPNAVRQEKRDNRVFSYDENGKPICGAKNRLGHPCKKSPMDGKNRCHLHGGKSIGGVAHYNFKDGKYSTYLPDSLSTKYKESVSDEKLLELKDEIALIEVRIKDLIEKLSAGEGGIQSWDQLRYVYSELVVAVQYGDMSAIASSVKNIGDVIDRGNTDNEIWQEMMSAFQDKRKLSDTERKRLNDMKQMMTNEQAMALMAFVVSTIKKHVTDTQILAAISQDINAFVAKK